MLGLISLISLLMTAMNRIEPVNYQYRNSCTFKCMSVIIYDTHLSLPCIYTVKPVYEHFAIVSLHK